MYTSIYDAEYHKKFLDRANTELGKQIYAKRWELIEKHCSGHMKLLDFGCASGAFHTSSRNGFETYGYDVNPYCGFPEIPKIAFDILTMWDSLEHMTSPFVLIEFMKPKFVFVSTPNLESVNGKITEWKHYRPKEHINYFDKHSLYVHFDDIGYDLVDINFEEGKLRDPENSESIITVVARKR